MRSVARETIFYFERRWRAVRDLIGELFWGPSAWLSALAADTSFI
jgi:hypothetical protein